ncbi:Protein HGV2 [Eumeta japonica]|uniref:Protein HGV2 n=1 Tax=Eumeta variegata TaxID=151549 RepID=A0A4C1VF25_EUMVA|nr:Protein HGV2 [Eumeta japonica]
MADVPEVDTMSPAELLAAGRRHLAVRDFHAATEALAKACEVLAKEHGDTADQCAESYLWYGKALLGLSREESGVLATGEPSSPNSDDDEDQNDDEEENEIKEETENADNEKKSEVSEPEKDGETKETEDPVSSTSTDKPGTTDTAQEPGTSNGETNDESAVDLDNEDDVDNLQLAWETLDLARSILSRRVEGGGGDGARALLAEVYLTLGEVALESETYDKAVLDMQSCLEIQKELYHSDDRLIAETHYQIGLANSLASNFEEAITHFKNAANILESRIKTLENPEAVANDSTIKEISKQNPFYTVQGEIKELKELLPEIQEKIQDMLDYKAETIKRVRETLCPANGASSHTNGAGPSSESKRASDISHLIKRKRKSSEGEQGGPAPKRMDT